MLSLKHFLNADHTKVSDLNNHYERFLTSAKLELHKGDFQKAEQFMAHATLMISELKKLNSNKKMLDEVEITLKKLNLRQMNDIMMQKRKDWF